MIQVNELRVGNWINVRYSANEIRPFCIDNVRLADLLLEDIFELNIIDCSPIGITPEILEACGFNCSSKGFWQHPDWYNISLKLRGATYDLRCNFMDRVATNIDYLHQLQNLHFVLVGKELIYNKP